MWRRCSLSGADLDEHQQGLASHASPQDCNIAMLVALRPMLPQAISRSLTLSEDEPMERLNHDTCHCTLPSATLPAAYISLYRVSSTSVRGFFQNPRPAFRACGDWQQTRTLTKSVVWLLPCLTKRGKAVTQRCCMRGLTTQCSTRLLGTRLQRSRVDAYISSARKPRRTAVPTRECSGIIHHRNRG